MKADKLASLGPLQVLLPSSLLHGIGGLACFGSATTVVVECRQLESIADKISNPKISPSDLLFVIESVVGVLDECETNEIINSIIPHTDCEHQKRIEDLTCELGDPYKLVDG